MSNLLNEACPPPLPANSPAASPQALGRRRLPPKWTVRYRLLTWRSMRAVFMAVLRGLTYF